MATSDSFYFGETPETLTAAGLDALPLAFTQSDFTKSTKWKHNVPRRVLKNLNKDLETALFAFVDGDRAGILTGDIDGDGKPLPVGIQIGVQMDDDRVNAIRSAYGLDNPGAWLKNQIDAGKTFTLLDEKRANTFLYPYGYLASRKEGIRSIDGTVTQPGEYVKQFSYSLKKDSEGRTLTEQQKDYFKDTTTKDDQGQLMVMYHGTRKGGFTVFSHKPFRQKRVPQGFRPGDVP